ncbi:hypothetical protein H4W23_40355 [Streptomyces gardneri]|uniref:hypothetical protein n=1 Tax=Streptomyces gardneri TaxID=66892 RepID=UPI0006BD46C7|nr:hypothetical protein [Streptomyces gardneri]QPK50213.1 hypothetical protein H4W23_40355 [Streptomyces gardneri]WRK41821.1 hypothetical protein U0M97_40610 [Streptomyces venezuelae]CUM35593.1 hypothetical protein BN2537_151 [Streptomyces venezuelae]
MALRRQAGTLEAAQEAKKKLARRLEHDLRVNGIGIGGTDSKYVVQVNLVDDSDRPPLPVKVNGIPVRAVVTGKFEI